GDDVVDGSGLSADSALLTIDGGDGDDVLLGSAGNDTILGGLGDDVLIGGAGSDVLDGGPGDNVVLDSLTTSTVTAATPVGPRWVISHTRILHGKTVLKAGRAKHVLPRATVARII